MPTRKLIGPIRDEFGKEIIRTLDEVTTILELHRKGWDAKRIARELGISESTVKR